MFCGRFSRSGLIALLCVIELALPPALAQQVILEEGTPVRLRLNRNLSSGDAKEGETVDFEVLDEIKVGETVVIAKGAIALATVTEAQAKRRMGRAGKLDINIDHVRLANGEKAALRAVKETSGGSNTGKMTGAIVATSIVFFPAAPLFLFVKGKDVTIPKGTEITAYVNGRMTLDPSKFTQRQSAAGAASPTLSAAEVGGKAMVNADVLALKNAGLSDEIIVAKIKSSRGAYKLDTADILELQKGGVSESVIRAMLEAQK